MAEELLMAEETASRTVDRGFFVAGGLLSAWLLALLTGFVLGGAVHLLLAAGLVVFFRLLRFR